MTPDKAFVAIHKTTYGEATCLYCTSEDDGIQVRVRQNRLNDANVGPVIARFHIPKSKFSRKNKAGLLKLIEKTHAELLILGEELQS